MDLKPFRSNKTYKILIQGWFPCWRFSTEKGKKEPHAQTADQYPLDSNTDQITLKWFLATADLNKRGSLLM